MGELEGDDVGELVGETLGLAVVGEFVGEFVGDIVILVYVSQLVLLPITQVSYSWHLIRLTEYAK